MVLGSSPVAVTSPSDFAPASSKEFLDIQATIECGFTLKRVRDMTRTYSFSNLFVLLIIDWLVVFGPVRAQQSEINRECFFINGSYYWCCWKIILGNWKTLVFLIYRFYIYFIKVFIPVDFIYNFFIYNEFIDMILQEIFCYILVLLDRNYFLKYTVCIGTLPPQISDSVDC